MAACKKCQWYSKEYDRLCQAWDDCIIEDEYDSKDLDELEAIIEEAMKEFNDSILNDEDDDELDYQDLRADMYQAIENAVVKNYSKVIK